MMEIKNTHSAYRSRWLLSLGLIIALPSAANETVSSNAIDESVVPTANVSNASPPEDRSLSEDQLSDQIRTVLQLSPDGEASGSANHPFTTKRASAQGSGSPISEYPWDATGKLFMKFGNSNFVCTASVVGKSLLVTAAHCVHNFGEGQNGFADSLSFEPGRYESSRPHGTWTAKQWWIPKAYFDGTDNCSANAPGVVCENDVAVVVLNTNEGLPIADLTGMYEVNDGPDGLGYGYVDFLGKESVQITQLGYPSRNFDGDKMIRTDSLGYKDDPNNVVIGSNQTGGSSGGPWLVNFGTDTSFNGPPATNDESNQVGATTSWGFTSGTVKLQGASRFSKNTIFTEKSNIRTLIDDACGANPEAC